MNCPRSVTDGTGVAVNVEKAVAIVEVAIFAEVCAFEDVVAAVGTAMGDGVGKTAAFGLVGKTGRYGFKSSGMRFSHCNMPAKLFWKKLF